MGEPSKEALEEALALYHGVQQGYTKASHIAAALQRHMDRAAQERGFAESAALDRDHYQRRAEDARIKELETRLADAIKACIKVADDYTNSIDGLTGPGWEHMTQARRTYMAQAGRAISLELSLMLSEPDHD